MPFTNTNMLWLWHLARDNLLVWKCFVSCQLHFYSQFWDSRYRYRNKCMKMVRDMTLLCCNFEGVPWVSQLAEEVATESLPCQADRVLREPVWRQQAVGGRGIQLQLVLVLQTFPFFPFLASWQTSFIPPSRYLDPRNLKLFSNPSEKLMSEL